MLERETRERRNFELLKWENYREARSLVKKKYKQRNEERSTKRNWVVWGTLAIILKKLRIKTKRLKENYRREAVQQASALRLQKSYFAWARSRSSSIVQRIGNQMRYENLCKTNVSHHAIYAPRARTAALWFLKQMLERKQISALMFQFWKRSKSL